MTEKTDFYSAFPDLLGELLPEILDDEIVLEYMGLFYETLVIIFEEKIYVTGKVKDKVRCRNIAICIVDEMLNDSLFGENIHSLAITKSMHQYFYGDIKIAAKIWRDWMMSVCKSSAQSEAIKALHEFAKMGEKFINSPGHANRKYSISRQHTEIINEYNKLLSQQIPKSIIYRRIENKFGIGARQVQRIKSKTKNDI